MARGDEAGACRDGAAGRCCRGLGCRGFQGPDLPRHVAVHRTAGVWPVRPSGEPASAVLGDLVCGCRTGGCRPAVWAVDPAVRAGGAWARGARGDARCRGEWRPDPAAGIAGEGAGVGALHWWWRFSRARGADRADRVGVRLDAWPVDADERGTYACDRRVRRRRRDLGDVQRAGYRPVLRVRDRAEGVLCRGVGGDDPVRGHSRSDQPRLLRQRRVFRERSA